MRNDLGVLGNPRLPRQYHLRNRLPSNITMGKRSRNEPPTMQHSAPGLRGHPLSLINEASSERSRWRWFCCSSGNPPVVTQQVIFHATATGDEDSADIGAALVPSPRVAIVEQQFDDSMFFFDAAQDSMDLAAMLELYPIMTTSNIPPKKNISLDNPGSMLGHEIDGTVFHDAKSYRNLVLEQSQRRLSLSISESHQLEQKTAVVKSHTRPRMMNRITSQFFTSTRQMQLLQEPRIQIHERGFPGSLSPDELEACVRSFNVAFVSPKKKKKILLTDFFVVFSYGSSENSINDLIFRILYIV